MNAELPWALILTGVGVAIVVEIVGVQVMPFCRGHVSALQPQCRASWPAASSAGHGGVVRTSPTRSAGPVWTRGVLYTSGLIAGEGLMGVVLAALAGRQGQYRPLRHREPGQLRLHRAFPGSAGHLGEGVPGQEEGLIFFPMRFPGTARPWGPAVLIFLPGRSPVPSHKGGFHP